jgi:hypothetical protein
VSSMLFLRCVVVGALLAALVQVSAEAQTSPTKSTPRLAPVVAREATRPVLDADAASAERNACAPGDEMAFRRFITECTGLTDRAARSACLQRVVDSRGASDVRVALARRGSSAPRTTAQAGRGAAQPGCV